MYHEIGSFYGDYYNKLYESILLYSISAVIVILFIFGAVKKYDFRIIVGIRQ